MGACGLRLGCLLGKLPGLARLVAASSGAQHQGNRQVEAASVAYRRAASAPWATDLPATDLTVAQDDTCTGGLCLVAVAPKSPAMLVEPAAPARAQDTWPALMEPALSGRTCHRMPSTSDAAPALRAYVAPHLGAHHAPALFQVQHARLKAVAGPMATKPRAAGKAAPEAPERLAQGQGHRQATGGAPEKRGPGRPSRGTARLEPMAHETHAARQEFEPISAPREPGAQRMRASGPADHGVDGERGVRRHGQRLAAALQAQLETRRTVAPQDSLSQSGVDRSAHAERVVPTRPATIAFVSGSVRQQGSHLHVTLPVSYALHAHLLPACSLERVAQTRTVPAGEPLRELAERRRTPLGEPGGALAALSEAAHSARQQQAKALAEVGQRSSAQVAGRHGSLALRNPPRRGLDRPRKRACVTAVHNFFLTRADGTTAAERFFGQKPRSMVAAIVASVALPPAPLSPPRRAEG